MSLQYQCPLCNHALLKHNSSLRCDNNHTFDFAKEGYVNLNYNFLAKIYSELTDSQKIKLKKILDHETTNVSKVV